MTAPTRSRANDISRLLNSRGFSECMASPPTTDGDRIIVTISTGFARAALDTLCRMGYTAHEGAPSEQRNPGYVTLEILPTRRSSTKQQPVASRPSNRSLNSYLPRPVTEQKGTWVTISPKDAKEINMFTWKNCHFQVSTGVDQDTGKVTTNFPTGYREGMEYFMTMHGFEGEILPGYVKGVSRAVWSRRFVPAKNG